eukprot:12401089-Karenia_brevis.AAC.1
MGCSCGGQLSAESNTFIHVWKRAGLYKHEHTLSTLYDMEKLYDKISISVLIKEASRLGYPPSS